MRGEDICGWDWNLAHSCEYPGQPGGVLLGDVHKCGVVADVGGWSYTQVITAEDLLAGLETDCYSEEIAQARYYDDWDIGEPPKKKSLIRLHRPPPLLGCLDRSEAAGHKRRR